MDTTNIYDIVIIGGGPGGLSAALYAARSELKTVVLESALLGGQIVTTTHVENYPGSIENCTGPRLIERMEAQATEFGAEIAYETAEEIIKEDELFTVKTSSKKSFQAKAVIAALGASPKMLGIPGEAEYRGRGVSYCATCDGGFFKGKEIAVIGGGDTALQEAIYLTRFATKVYIVHRRDEFRGCKSLESKARKNPKIEMVLNSLPQRIIGSTSVEGLEIKNKITEEISVLNVSGVFLFVGYQPNTDMVKELVELDAQGYALSDTDMSTKTPGLYAIGDMTRKPLRQVVTAASDGAIASISAEKYIEALND
jgi:thioredoxin reductase (NADPH)